MRWLGRRGDAAHLAFLEEIARKAVLELHVELLQEHTARIGTNLSTRATLTRLIHAGARRTCAK
jgi:hypothetical protein